VAVGGHVVEQADEGLVGSTGTHDHYSCRRPCQLL
jgi:hypothetical protein